MVTTSAPSLTSLITDDVVLEGLYQMRQDQPPKDRLKYGDIVFEGSTEKNAILLQKLYTDIIAKSNIDFGTIPDSRGNLVKYSGYPLIQQSMDRINALFSGVSSEEVTLMNEIHDMIVSCKTDFMYGFTMQNEFVKVTYNTAVMTLYELINICILSYAKKLRSTKGIDFEFGKVKKKDLIVIKNAKSLLKGYKNGQWNTAMKAFRNNPGLLNVSPATEGSLFGKDVSFGEGIKGIVDTIGKVPSIIKIPLMAIAAIIGLMMIVRGLISLFWTGVVKIRDYAKVQQKFVDITLRTEEDEGVDEKTLKFHQTVSNKLGDIANFIEVRVLQSDKKAKEEIRKSNAENFQASDFTDVGFGGDVEF